MMDDSIIEREIKIINPKLAGDYAAICEKAKQWEQSGETLQVIKGPGEYEVVVMHVPYHEVKTEEEIRSRAVMEEFLEDLDRYHVTLPREFIKHVMSDEGTAYLKEQEQATDSWTGRIQNLKKQEGVLCLLPDNAGAEKLKDF